MIDKQSEEDVLYPDLLVVDAHHHLLDKVRPATAAHLGLSRYLVDEYTQATADGHRVVASVVMEARSMYRLDGPESLRPVGETEFLNGQAAMAASGLYGACRVAAGIVGYADLSQGEAVRSVLEAHIAAAPARFRGIRHEGVWDPDPKTHGEIFDVPEKLYASKGFRRGFAQLAPLGLTFDAFVLASQLEDVTALARAFPETDIILNHVGSPVGILAYQGRLKELFPEWKRHMADIAACPNASVKLGGLGSFLLGSTFYRSGKQESAETLAKEWRPYVEVAIELFGADRCMFESNLPTDGSGSFRGVCNAYKRLTDTCTSGEREAIFAGTAARIYKLGEVAELAVGGPQ